MPTTREEKPAKPRQRSRKTDQRKTDQRKAKGDTKSEARPEVDPVSAIMAPIEAAPAEIAPVEIAPLEMATVEAAPVALTVETERDAALSGEVLPPQAHEPAPQAAGLVAITQAHSDYMRKSWLSGRFLVERLTAARSFDEALAIQGEFARQACANFVAQSERISALYGAWAQQLFAAAGKSQARWTRVGR